VSTHSPPTDGDSPALSAPPSAQPGHGLSILVVEDNQSVGEILASALEQEGCTTVLTSNGAAVVELAQRLHPNLITLDLAHAELRGSEVIASLRSDSSTRDIPIIALSARAHDLAPPMEGQVARIFGEPFYLAEVVSAVLQTLGRA
jgi:two-component system OmpR family response regulator